MSVVEFVVIKSQLVDVVVVLIMMVMIVHNAFQCGTYRPPLPRLSTYIAKRQGYDLRQSTSTQLIPSYPADLPRQSGGPEAPRSRRRAAL